MSNHNELKTKITNWLIEEGITYSESPDENADFRLHVNWGYATDIVKEKGKKSIGNTASMGFQEEKVVKAFNKLTKKEKDSFIHDLEIELIKFPLIYHIYPETLERIDGVVFDDYLYVEDLTKTEFIHSLERVRRGMYFLNLFATDRLHMDMDATESYDRKAGVA